MWVGSGFIDSGGGARGPDSGADDGRPAVRVRLEELGEPSKFGIFRRSRPLESMGGPGAGYPPGMGSHKRNKHDSGGVSARGRRHPGSGARGRQGATVEHSPDQRHEHTATGSAGTERDHGRSKAAGEGRVNRQGTA